MKRGVPMAEIFVKLPADLRREVMKRTVYAEMEDLIDKWWEMKLIVENMDGKESKPKVVEDIRRILAIAAPMEIAFGVCLSRKFRNWRVWLREMGFEADGVRRYFSKIHVYPDHFYDYGCKGNFIKPYLYVCKNGGVIDNRFGWDLEFYMKKRVAKVFIELEKVVRGLADEVKLEGDVYEEDQDEMEEEDVKKKRKF